MIRKVSISVVTGDVTSFDADVLVLKYAQALYGADKAVHERLSIADKTSSLPVGMDYALNATHGKAASRYVLFVGVEPLRSFGYAEIRHFARRALSYLSKTAPDARHLVFTIHGPGYGLDEIEAFQSELAGVADGVASGAFPAALSKISFVEMNPNRAQRLSASLKQVLPAGYLPINDTDSLIPLERGAADTLRTAGDSTKNKPHIFVAMPFIESMDDVFHYGIQGAVNSAGFLCERADLSTFTGDVIGWVKQRISSAKLVIADLSMANPNVYLEVGYAWGREIPTVLLAKENDELKFDVKGHRCIVYKSIKNLEDSLGKELSGLSKNILSTSDIFGASSAQWPRH